MSSIWKWARENPDDVIKFCQLLEPTCGGINLEDIKAPECFYIEETLRKTMSIPAFHDDQHGTAIISGAALLNALELVGKKIDQVRVVFNGAGAAGLASALHYVRLGVRKENITMCDINGVIYEGRAEGMNPYNSRFAVKTSKRRLAEVLEGADVFVGLSVGDCVTPEMLQPMAERPIIFALANPTPEISYEKAKAARPDAIVATGRSDFPNQVNNVLGFPGIFRGALDVRARAINEEMKVAATHALAALAKEDVPDSVLRAYGLGRLQFGPSRQRHEPNGSPLPERTRREDDPQGRRQNRPRSHGARHRENAGDGDAPAAAHNAAQLPAYLHLDPAARQRIRPRMGEETGRPRRLEDDARGLQPATAARQARARRILRPAHPRGP